MIRKFLIPLLILVLAGGTAFALFKTRPKPEPIVVEENVSLVHVMPAVFGRHEPELVLYGVVESPATAQLRAAIGADVSAVNVREGDRVEQNQVLVRLDSREMQLVVQQREADLAQIDADIASEKVRHEGNLSSLPVDRELLSLSRKASERAKDLVKRKVGSRSNLDAALQDVQRQLLSVKAREQGIREFASRMARLKASRVRAEALLEQARLDLEHSVIRAPFSGRVASVSVAVGDRVRVGDTVLEMFDSAALQVRAQISNRHVAAVRKALRGGPLSAAASVDDTAVSLSLRGFAGRAGDGAGVYGLFDVTKGGDGLPLGRFVTLRMRLPAVDGVVAVPTEALYGANRIYTVADGRLHGMKVTIIGEMRRSDEQLLLVRADELKPNDPIVVTQLPNAIEGLAVTSE